MTRSQGLARFPVLLKLLFTLCVALTGVATVALVVASLHVTRSNRDVEHTLHVQQALETLQLAIVNAETGQRGYLLTGERHFLEPYIEAVAGEAYTIGALERLTADNPAEREAVQALKAMADEALQHMAVLLNAPAGAPPPIDELNRGKVLVDRVRLAIEGMRNEQDRMLADRQREVDRRTRYGFAVLLVSDAASLLGIALLYLVTQGYHRRRVRAEAALAQRERESRDLFDEAPIGAAECDAASGRILRANRRLAELTGHAPDELLRTSVIDLMPRSDLLDNARSLRELVAGEHDVIEWEEPLQVKNGDPLWVAVKMSAVPSPSGAVERVIATIDDISARKREEQALEGRAALMRAIVDDTRHIAFAKDLDGRYLFVNSALVGALERPAEEIVGQCDDDLFPPECAGEMHRHDRRIAESRAADTFELTLDFAHESRTYVVTMAPFHEAADHVAGVVGIGTDVTERKRDELRLRDELARSKARLGSPAEVVTAAVEEERKRLAMELHDELGAATSAVWVELVRMQAPLKAAAPELLGPQQRALKALTDMSDKLRRLTAGLHPLLLDHAGLAAALGSYVSDWALQADVRAQCHIDDPLPVLDPGQGLALFRIAQEALNNVAKHADASTVQVTLAASNDGVRLTIADDGVGLRPDPADPCDTRGLQTMRARAEQLGGTCWVGRRGPAGGTEVTVRIPVHDASDQTRAPARADANANANARAD